MKKIFVLLMVATMAIGIISCDKDNGSGGNSGTPATDPDATPLSNLKFHWKKTNYDGTWEGLLTFGAGKTMTYHVTWDWPEYEVPHGDITLQGTCTFREENDDGIRFWRGHMSFTGDGVVSSFETDYGCDGNNMSMEHPPQHDYFALERVRE